MEDIRKIEIILTKNENNEECLKTIVNKNKFEINFSSDDQKDLRNLFLNCFIEGEINHFKFILKKDGCVKNTIIEKVASDYIEQLNIELNNVFENIDASLKEK